MPLILLFRAPWLNQNLRHLPLREGACPPTPGIAQGVVPLEFSDGAVELKSSRQMLGGVGFRV